MKKKNGFTMIELFAVIIIIGIISVSVVVTVRKYLNKGYNEYYKGLSEQVELAAKDYYSKNKEELPSGKKDSNGILYVSELNVDILERNNYLENEVVDKSGNSCKDSYVLTNYNSTTNKHDYYVCLICDNKLVYGDSKYCLLDGVDKYAPVCKITHNIEVDTDKWVTSATLNFKITDDVSGFKKLSNKDKVIKEVEPTKEYETTYDLPNGIIDLSKLTFNVIDNQDHMSYCNSLTGTVKIDNEKPICTITKKVVSEEEIKLVVETKDELSKVKELTSINNLEQNSDGSYKITKEGTYEFKVEDNALNTNTCSINIKQTDFDVESPVIKVTVTPGLLASLNIKITDNVGVKGYQITSSSETPKEYIDANNVKEFTTTTSINNAGTYYIHATDEAGNTAYKKIVLEASSWSSYSETECDTTTNPNTCLKTSGYLKQTRSSSRSCVTKTKNCHVVTENCGTTSCPPCTEAWYYNGTYYPAKCSTCAKTCSHTECETYQDCTTTYGSWSSGSYTASCSSGSTTKCTVKTLYQTRTISCSEGCEAS